MIDNGGVKVTVLTPTYNRGHLLGKLYESLVVQTRPNFEWLIIDDGSNDNTKIIVDQFIFENKIKIKYYYKTNGGKHTALNIGIGYARGELTFIVDSDDYLTPDAIEVVENLWNTIPDDKKNQYAGVAASRGKSKNEMIGNFVEKQDLLDATYAEFRSEYKIKGDKAEVYRTDLLKSYQFPVFFGERFITEAILWNRIATLGYPLRWSKEIIYICEYLENGLSARYWELVYNNPQGYALFHNEAQCIEKSFLPKLYHNYNYYMNCLVAEKSIKNSFMDDNLKLYSLWGMPLGVLKYAIRYRKIKQLQRI